MAAKLGIIADDFTGALLVAGVLEGMGISAPVFFDPAAVSQASVGAAEVVVLATRSRTIAVDQALQALQDGADGLQRAGVQRLAYKACASFDSTEAGNIGPAADYLAARAGGLPVLFSAGYPRFNATVHQGYLFYRSRLVSESVKRFDPLTPMSDPDLVRFLSHQTRSPVASLSHLQLCQGAETVLAAWDRLRAEGVQHVLADTSDDGDVAASVALALARPAVVVASDPLIIGYAQALATAGPHPDPAQAARVDGPGAVILGSVGPTATAQITRFAASGHPVLTLDLLDPRPEAAVIAAALEWAQPHFGATAFGISTSTGAEDVAAVQAQLGQVASARKAERLLAAIAVGLRDMGLRRLVVSGGETSGAVVTALGLRQLRALPETPLGSGFCLAEGPAPLALFLKSGKLGADDVFARALSQMGAA